MMHSWGVGSWLVMSPHHSGETMYVHDLRKRASEGNSGWEKQRNPRRKGRVGNPTENSLCRFQILSAAISPPPSPLFQKWVIEKAVDCRLWAWLEMPRGLCVKGERWEGWNLWGPGRARGLGRYLWKAQDTGWPGLRRVRTGASPERGPASPQGGPAIQRAFR